MKKSTVTIIVAVCLIVAGIAIAGAAFSMTGFDFKNFDTESYEEVTRTVEGDFKHIVIATQIHNIDLAPSTDGICKVVGDENDSIKIETKIEGDILTVKTVDTREWYNFIGINLEEAGLTLYLPESEYTSLTAASDTGHINIPESFAFTGASMATATGAIVFRAKIDQELALASRTGSISVSKQNLSKLDVENSTGKISIENIEASSSVRAEANTGKIELKDIKCNSIDVETTTGNISLQNVIAEADISISADTGKISLLSCLSDSLNIDTDTGDVKLDACDANSIDIETETGDVMGYLLTPKIFDTDTNTGDIRVPQSTSGGICKIRTSTGNIIITIE